MKAFRRVLVTLALTAGLGLTLAPAAAGAAVMPGAQVQASSSAGCSKDTFITTLPSKPFSEICAGAYTGFLPVDRWSSATGTFHLRAEGGWTSIPSDLALRLQRQATGPMWMSAGNAMWKGATSLASEAVALDLMKTVGSVVDKAFYKMSKALFSSALVAVIVVVVLGVVLWRASRGRASVGRHLVKICVVLIVLGTMMAGANRSTGSGSNFVPGPGSPSWVVQTANDVISIVAQAPAAALTAMAIDESEDLRGSDTGAGSAWASNPLSCQKYVGRMKAAYAKSVNDSGYLLGAPEGVRATQSTIPVIMSSLWEQTGLRVWKSAQFGSDNDYADFMYCRLLEARAGISPTAQAGMIGMGAVPTKPGASHTTEVGNHQVSNANSAAWGAVGDNFGTDRTLVAWASCRWDYDAKAWKIAGDWDKVDRSWLLDKNKIGIPTDACASWWNDSYYSADGPGGGIVGEKKSELNFTGSGDDTLAATSNAPQAKDFLISLHGAGASAGIDTSTMVVYAFGALIALLVFGAISVGLILAKVMVVVMALVFGIVLLKDLATVSGDGSGAVRVARTTGVLLVVMAGMSLVFAFIALITSVLVAAASGAPEMFLMMWASVAPAVAMLVLHLVFTKVLRVASPLTLKGLASYRDSVTQGSLAPAAGGRMGGRVKGMAAQGTKVGAAVAARKMLGLPAVPGRGGADGQRPGRQVGRQTLAGAAAGGIAGAAVGTAAGANAAAGASGSTGAAGGKPTGPGPTPAGTPAAGGGPAPARPGASGRRRQPASSSAPTSGEQGAPGAWFDIEDGAERRQARIAERATAEGIDPQHAAGIIVLEDEAVVREEIARERKAARSKRLGLPSALGGDVVEAVGASLRARHARAAATPLRSGARGIVRTGAHGAMFAATGGLSAVPTLVVAGVRTARSVNSTRRQIATDRTQAAVLAAEARIVQAARDARASADVEAPAPVPAPVPAPGPVAPAGTLPPGMVAPVFDNRRPPAPPSAGTVPQRPQPAGPVATERPW